MERKLVVLTSPLRVMVPIIKIVGDFCNLRCSYCFYNTRDQLTPHVMEIRLLEKFISEYMQLFSGPLYFIWHGGEPLLAGIPFFQKILELQTRNLRDGYTIKNAVQTNATLVNDEWADFLKVHNFRVGVSLDGGRESHDHFRKNHGGKGSFDQVVRGVEMLRRHGIEPGFIQTLTHDNVARAEDDFNFFAKIVGAKRWGTNEFFDIQTVNKAMAGQSIMNEELTQFLKICVDSWLAADNPELQIREIDNFLSGVYGKRAPSCTFNGTCTGYFCLEYNGEIYPCDRLSNRSELLFGDLSKQSLSEVLNSPARLKYAEAVNSLHPDCAKCEWQKACHNGCTANRIGGPGGKYYFCETRKAIFAYLREKVDEYRANKPTTKKRREPSSGSQDNRQRRIIDKQGARWGDQETGE